VCVLEKGKGIGSHLISGCLLEPKALLELLPNKNFAEVLYECKVRRGLNMWKLKESMYMYYLRREALKFLPYSTDVDSTTKVRKE
jgi:flavin-dependent dehydrogenase